MNLNMVQLDTYQREIKEWQEKLEEAKAKLAFLRLQSRQTRACAARAIRNPLIKAFIKAMPKDFVEVMPSPGTTYVSVDLSPMQASLYASVPESLGLEYWETVRLTDSLSSPVCWKYRSRGVVYYINKWVV